MDNETLELVAEWADIVQIGARNMQNFSLLKQAGRLRMPVLLKRGMSATLDELLMAAEYIMSEGNYEVILCERGVRTFADHTRNTLDLSIVPAVQKLSHLPIWSIPAMEPASATRCCRWRARRWRWALMAFWSRCTTSRRRRSPMVRSRFIRISLRR